MMSQILRPEDTAARLLPLLWCEFELSRMAAGWVPAVRKYESKQMLGRLHYLHNRNVKWLHDRVKELPGSFHDKNGSPAPIREAFERFASAEHEAAFYSAYAFVLDQLTTEYERLYDELDPLLDAPTVDQLDLICGVYPKIRRSVREAYQQARRHHDQNKSALPAWQEYNQAVWACMNASFAKPDPSTLWPPHPVEQPAGPVPIDSAWDEDSFPLYPSKGKPSKSYDDPSMSPLYDSVKQMHFINATEISAAEMLCHVYYGVQRMPLEFYYDLARHNWDEFRHSEMGVRRLRELGHHTNEFQFTKGSPGHEVAKEWFPDVYASLTMVAEPCSFIKKKKSTEAFRKHGDELSAVHCEFDMADERMHVDFGKKWGPELFKQLGDMITAEQMSERARKRRLEQLSAGDEEEIKKIIKNFPAFCGFSTTELNYDAY